MTVMSATEKQIEANRANAQHSTGPVTGEGKAASSRNALSHGLTAKDLFVPAGEEGDFEALKEGLFQDLSPDSLAETLLANHVVSASWKLLRCDRSEAELASRTSQPGLDPLLDPTLESTVRTIERARTQAAKLLHQSLAELRRVQTEHHYRLAAMPEDEGYITDCLGLSDWQIIRTRLKKERNLDAANEAREARAQADAAWVSIDASMARHVEELKKANQLQAAQPPAKAATPNAKTNPPVVVRREFHPLVGIEQTNPLAIRPELRGTNKFEQTNPLVTTLRR
jgi:hypothetical protein